MSRTVLLILLSVLGSGLLAVVLCCGGFLWLANQAAAEAPKAQAAVDEFFDRIAEGQSEVAYQSTTQAFRKSVSPEQFDGFLKALPANVSRSGRKVSFVRYNTINGVAQIFFRVTSGGKSCTAIVMQEGGEWKVHHLSVP